MFQIINENNKPKFVVLPFGNEAVARDYLDELWARKAVKKFKKNPPKKLIPLREIRAEIGV